jgi:NAD(P)H-dependent FMN reductase
MEQLQIAVIIASVREGRGAALVANWFTGQAREREDMHLDVIDLLETPPPARLGATGPETDERLGKLSPRLEAADAFVVITCEYNKSFPASVKDLIDWHFTQWQAKPVAFVSYGGISGGLRAVEHLRLVFSEVHAATIRDGVVFPNYWEKFGPNGCPTDPERFGAAAKTMLDQLAWWATALRTARAERPYGR